MNTLKAALTEWTDFDVAAHALAQALGLMPEDAAMREYKAVYWSNNSLGNLLHSQLEQLVAEGILEKLEERYRWCSTYQLPARSLPPQDRLNIELEK